MCLLTAEILILNLIWCVALNHRLQFGMLRNTDDLLNQFKRTDWLIEPEVEGFACECAIDHCFGKREIGIDHIQHKHIISARAAIRANDRAISAQDCANGPRYNAVPV